LPFNEAMTYGAKRHKSYGRIDPEPQVVIYSGEGPKGSLYKKSELVEWTLLIRWIPGTLGNAELSQNFERV